MIGDYRIVVIYNEGPQKSACNCISEMKRSESLSLCRQYACMCHSSLIISASQATYMLIVANAYSQQNHFVRLVSSVLLDLMLGQALRRCPEQ